MSPLTTALQPFRLQVPEANCHLHVRSFTGEEGVSRLFQFRLVAHADLHIPTAALLGQPAKFVMQERCFLAVIASVDELGSDEHGRTLYALELVPRLWAMTRTVQARVFADQDALGIIDKVFEGTGIRVEPPTGTETPPVRPYCVQYFESDFDFAVRLLEEEGYVYEYAAQGDQPVFAIRELSASRPHAGEVPFHDVTGGPEERIVSWKKTRVLAATGVHAHDHLFEAATPRLEASASLPETPPIGWEPLAATWSASIGRYPGGWAHQFEEVQSGGGIQKLDGYVKAGERRAGHDLRQAVGWTSGSEGAGNCTRLVPGCCFRLVYHPTSSGEYFVVSVSHKGSQAFDHSSREASGFAYENRFTCVPDEAARTVWLPPRSTRKPVIHGCQTAVVTGAEGGKEIWTDKYGRVQVRFWWQDEESASSCWIRVATPWAGNGWGIQHIPRVGQEVVVTFLDGDPDRPLIVGSVYNPSNMPPFEFGDGIKPTRSGIRTRSTEGGVTGESNEIRFEDAKGAEEVYFQAQKDRTSVVKNESRELVAGDRYDVVGNDFHAIAVRNKREGIGGTSDLLVAGDCMNYVQGKLGIKAKEIHFQAEKIVIEAKDISICTGSEKTPFICLNGDGITIESKGKEIWLNCGGKSKPDTGCYTEPAQPKLRFQSIDPDESEFGKLTK